MTAICMAALSVFPVHAAEEAPGPDKVVNYEAFAALGDGKTDDLPAICAAHAHANRHGLRVRSKPDAIYHLGRRAITAVIATDTDWGTSRFIIDDSKGVDDSGKALFEVSSLLKPLPLKIDHLKRGQARLDANPANDCLVYVENKNRKLFIRRGLNQNNGTEQKEVFILRRDGTIEGGIDWDYETVTRVVATPIDEKTLSIRGGVFTNNANRMDPGGKPSNWARNIRINRSKTLVEGVTHRVTGETDIGHPYHGFLSANRCAMVVLWNCVIDGTRVSDRSLTHPCKI